MSLLSNVTNVYEYDGSLASVLAGGLLNVSLLNTGSGPLSGAFVDDDAQLSQADDGTTTFALTGGTAQPINYIGSGTIGTVGVLGITLFPRPVAVFEAGGQIYFYAPEGLPPLSGLSFSLSINPNAPFDLPPGMLICFATGTRIATDRGPKPIEDLRVGDLVATCDHGFKAIRWIGSQRISRRALRMDERLRPVRIAAGALGDGLPERDLLVTRQHRLCVTAPPAAARGSAGEVLVPAKDFCGSPGAAQLGHEAPVEYWHLLFDAHELVLAEGVPAESLFLGVQARRSIEPADIAELRAIFPGPFAEPDKQGTWALARPELRGRRARRLIGHLAAAGGGFLRRASLARGIGARGMARQA